MKQLKLVYIVKKSELSPLICLPKERENETPTMRSRFLVFSQDAEEWT